MKTWKPWTITDGTLQLTEWPDHGQVAVVVEVDVFAAQEVAVVDLEGDIVCHTLPPGVGSHDTDPWDYNDVLRDLFAHIDAHPQTHYVLRTLHPERVRKVWPDLSPCRTDVCHRGDGITCPEDSCDRETGVLTERRRNVTLSLGPLATQPEADRLVPRVDLDRLETLAAVEFFMVPSERIRIDFWTEYGLECGYCREWRGVEDECERVDEADGSDWWFRCPLCGEQTAHTPTDETLSPRTRITVTGGEQPLHPDNVRCLRDQATEAGVAFAFLGWGEWMPESQGCGQDSDEDCEAVWQCVCGETAYPLTDNVRCRCGDAYTEEWCRQLRVGSENSGNTLDGRTWPWELEEPATPGEDET